MTYEIGNLYRIGDSYMIGQPAMQTAMQLHPGVALQHPAMLQQAAMLQPAHFAQYAPQIRSVPQGVLPFQTMPPPTVVHKYDPTESKLQPLGCNYTTNIDVAGTQIATAVPQRVFKPERYMVPDTVAPDFNINSIFIGVELQSPAAGAIAAESFLANAIYSNVDFTTCQISQTISVSVTNKGGAARPYYSTFYGRTIY